LAANVITYSAVIACCPWEWALQLLKESEDALIQADLVPLGHDCWNQLGLLNVRDADGS